MIAMQAACEKLFKRYLKLVPGRDRVFAAQGRVMVIVETRQWKLSYSSLEGVSFDISDPGGLFIEMSKEDKGQHLIPWGQLLRITVNEGPAY